MKPVRLQKALALAGVASRRAAERLIRVGAVMVNGRVITEMGTTVTPGEDRISAEGRELVFPDACRTLMLNKPRGYICSTHAGQGRTVFSLLGADGTGLFTVGRLDKDSEGLLLLTRDGDLAHRLTHPRYAHRKVYAVTVAGPVSAGMLSILRSALVLDGKPIQPAKVRHLAWDPDLRQTVLAVELREGRNRQIRRMCEQAGLRIRRLCRVQVSNLRLGALPTGCYRALTDREQAALLEENPESTTRGNPRSRTFRHRTARPGPQARVSGKAVRTPSGR